MESPFGMSIGGGSGQQTGYYAGNDALMNAKMGSIPTMKDRIDLAVRQAEEKLVAVKRARELFDKNPDLEELLNIMQRMHF